MTELVGRLRQIKPADLFVRLTAATSELAVLDLREEGRFGDGHLLTASSLPLSRLELGIGLLVPRLATPIVVYDDAGDGAGAHAGKRLAEIGYTDVSILTGGIAAWQAQGLEVYDGLNTPSKALGVYAHRELAIPEIQAHELEALKTAGCVVVLDCRPFNEYQNGCIPGAMSCPGAELVDHAPAVAMDGQKLVINCAGRTRGLVGAQSLIDSGYVGTVLALRDGTMGWQLSGRDVEKGAARSALDQSTRVTSGAPLERAARIRQCAEIDVVDAAMLESYIVDQSRTTVIFDIRDARDFKLGHISGARHVAGGQLVQTLDMQLATQGARIVVSDDDGVRASGVALWLKRMGCRDVFVARINDGGFDVVTDAFEPTLPAFPDTVDTISPSELRELIDAGRVSVIDLASSRAYRQGHIEGAWSAVRQRLRKLLATLPPAEMIALTSEDGRLATYAAGDEVEFPGRVVVLEGGTAAWQAAGYELSRDLTRLADRPDDIVMKPSELAEGPERDQAMRIYLAGSEELLAKVEAEGVLKFRAIPIV